jgi:MFS family permease
MGDRGESAITPRYAIYALVIIFLANLFNYLDRFLISAVLRDIGEHFNLSAPQKGLLWTAFTIGYMVSAPFIGYLSDRGRRTHLFGICIFIWSLATIGTAIAPGYLFLIACRVVIGIGEAGCLIIGPTLVSDYFVPEVRGRRLAVFYLGMPIGGVLGYITGGVLSTIGNWQLPFWAAGIPGIMIALLVVLLIEPPRGMSEGKGPTLSSAGVTQYLRLLKRPTLLFIILAQAAATFAFIPMLHYGVEYLETERGLARYQATLIYGGIAAVAGLGGNFAGGWFGDRLFRKTSAAYALTAGIAFIAGFPFVIVALFCDIMSIYLPALLIAFFFYFICMPSVNTHIANVSAPAQRAMAYAAAVFAVHIFGDTISPPLFGALREHFSGLLIPHSWTLTFFVFSFFIPMGGVLSLLAARSLTKEKGLR